MEERERERRLEERFKSIEKKLQSLEERLTQHEKEHKESKQKPILKAGK